MKFFLGECYGEYFEKSTLTLAIAWCCQATNHYLNQSWPRSIASLNSSPPSASYMRQWIGSALIQIMACCLFSAEPLSEPILGYYTPRFNEVEGGYTGFITPPSERGVYWFHLVRPSVHLWTKPCSLCIFNNARRIHFIFAHLMKQLQKVCCV